MGHCKYNEIKIVKFSSALHYPFVRICRQKVVVAAHREKKSATDSTKRTAVANF